jgi:hypothetical protein
VDVLFLIQYIYTPSFPKYLLSLNFTSILIIHLIKKIKVMKKINIILKLLYVINHIIFNFFIILIFFNKINGQS